MLTMAVLIVGRGVAELGQKWRTIAGRLPGRSDDAVRNRWKRLAKARPNPNDPEGAFLSAEPREPIRRPPRAAWSLEEDQTIVEMVERLGFKWGKIEQVLEGRTSHAIRNRFYRMLQQQQEQQQEQQEEQELQGHAVSGQVLAPIDVDV